MPGPAPKPTNLKIAEGNPGKRAESAPPTGQTEAEMPEGLSPEAEKAWREYAPKFTRLGLLKDIDAQGFAMLCTTWAAWQQLIQQGQSQGQVVRINGQPTPNPYLVRADKEGQKLHKLLAEFGATPASRARLEIENPESENESLDSFITNAA